MSSGWSHRVPNHRGPWLTACLGLLLGCGEPLPPAAGVPIDSDAAVGDAGDPDAGFGSSQPGQQLEVLAGSEDYDALNPSLSGDLLAWADLKDDSNGACNRPAGEDADCAVRLVARDLRSGVEHILDGDRWLTTPQAVDGRAIAFVDTEGHVRLFHFDEARHEVVSDGASRHPGPISAGGDAIAWYALGDRQWGIRIWSLSQQRLTVIPLNEGSTLNRVEVPVLANFGNRVAIVRHRQRPDRGWGLDLWWADISGAVDPELTPLEGDWLSDKLTEELSPYTVALTSDHLLFKAWLPVNGVCDPTAGCRHTLHALELTRPRAMELSTDDGQPSASVGLRAHGDRVVWLDASAAFFRVVVANLNTGHTSVVSPEDARPVAKVTPILSDNWVVWADAASGRPQIVGAPIP